MIRIKFLKDADLVVALAVQENPGKPVFMLGTHEFSMKKERKTWLLPIC